MKQQTRKHSKQDFVNFILCGCKFHSSNQKLLLPWQWSYMVRKSWCFFTAMKMKPVSTTNPFPKPFPLSQTKHMISSEKRARKFWPWWSQQELKSVPKQSQKLAKHLSDKFVSRTLKQQNWGFFFLLKVSWCKYVGEGWEFAKSSCNARELLA